MNVPFSDLEIAARTVWGEARNQDQTGRLAVAYVIRNRWQSDRWFGKGTVEDVCLREWQFSCHNKGDPNKDKLAQVALDNTMLQKCLHASLTAFLGLEEDPTNMATHYFHVDLATPYWAEGKTAECVIGEHVFYKNIN